jgi:hypothetical protein
VGFDAAWVSKAAICILAALVAGLFGSPYFGTKYLDAPPRAADRTIESKAASESAPGSPVERDPGPSARTAISSDADSDRTVPRQTGSPSEATRSGREASKAESREELRIGQQERRRLRAERRKNLENTNARMQTSPNGKPRQTGRSEPFFPFR